MDIKQLLGDDLVQILNVINPHIVPVPGTPSVPKLLPSLSNIKGRRIIYFLDDEESEEEFEL